LKWIAKFSDPSSAHWHWVDPNDSIAVVDFEEFLRRFRESKALNLLIDGLLSWDWLPIEEHNFHVEYVDSSVNGALIESALFREGDGYMASEAEAIATHTH
jgi:hypothetical protein